MKYAIFFVVLFSMNAYSCDCAFIDIESAVSKYEYIASGNIDSIVENNDKSNPYMELEGNFTPLKIYKGSKEYSIKAYGSKNNSGASCNVKLIPGRAIVFASKGSAIFHLCGPSFAMEGYSEVDKKYFADYLEYLYAKANGINSSFKSKLSYKELNEVFKKYTKGAEEIVNKYNSKVTGNKNYRAINVFISKNGAITKLESYHGISDNENMKKELYGYFSQIKFRESYSDTVFMIFLDLKIYNKPIASK